MRRRAGLAAAAAIALLGLGTARAAPLTPLERAGKRIYLEGESPSGGNVTAQVGGDVILPGSSLPCASCHGEDGRGRPEGGVTPSDVTWSAMRVSYGHDHPDGRKHPRFDERSLARSIETGLDPGGNAMDRTMPRYAMSRRDMEALVAYMKVLEDDLDPGLSRSAIRIGTVLPTRGRLAEMGRAMRRVLQGYWEAVNAGGGLHGRRVKLVVAGYDGDRETGLEAARRLLGEPGVFALVSGFAPRAEAELAELVERERVPLVGPLTPFTPAGEAPGSWVFYVLGGVREEAEALAEYAAGRLGLPPARVAIVQSGRERLAEAAGAARARLAARGWKEVDLLRLEPGRGPRDLADEVRRLGAEVVLFLGSDAEALAFGAAFDESGSRPWLLLPGSLAGRAAVEAPPSLRRRIAVALPTLPGDEKPAAAEAFARLAAPRGGQEG
ncbi:MAG TPA: ABC transporter substrate-binding protein, partial [Anaeromyxobacteraceae bacterium]|nr:ABC transporter substrate-binding protein [Anaeromyxobacteraceae bacterium]